MEAAQALGIPWTVRLIAPKGAYPAEELVVPVTVQAPLTDRAQPPWTVTNWALLRLQVARWLRRHAGNYDLVLLRNSIHDPFQCFWLYATRTPVLLVSHTMELAELQLGDGSVERLRARLEQRFGPCSARRAAGFVGVTQEILDYQLQEVRRRPGFGVVYPNGVSDQAVLADDRREHVPEFMFLASQFSPWHGLDLLLDMLDIDPSPMQVHVIGHLPPDLQQRATVEQRIRLHGTLSQGEIRNVAAQCWVGLSALGLHRKKMQEACPLKVREYLALGLPVAASHRESLPEGFPYYRRIGLSLRELVDFAAEVRSTSRSTVRDAAMPHISKSALLHRLYSQLSDSEDPQASWLR